LQNYKKVRKCLRLIDIRGCFKSAIFPSAFQVTQKRKKNAKSAKFLTLIINSLRSLHFEKSKEKPLLQICVLLALFTELQSTA